MDRAVSAHEVVPRASASKLIGTTVINDKNEKIGTVDDIVAEAAARTSQMHESSDDILDRMRTREVTGVFHSRKAPPRRCAGTAYSGKRPR
jgi:hypothetical protein